MCLTKLLVMKKEFCMVIAFAMALAGLFMLMFMSFDYLIPGKWNKAAE